MKLTIILFVLFNTMVLNAQEYIEFPDSNTTWKITKVNYPDLTNNIPLDEYSILTSTAGKKWINNIEYTVFKNEQESYNDYPDTILVRENNKVIYYYNLTDLSEKVLYDFNMNIGDTINLEFQPDFVLTVQDIDSVLIGSKFHKRFVIVEPDEFGGHELYSKGLSIIEGIGSDQGVFYHYNYLHISGGEYHFDCFTKNDTSYSINGDGEFDLDGVMCAFTFDINEEEEIGRVFYEIANKRICLEMLDNVNALSYDIVNVLGQIVQSGKLQECIDVSRLNNGLYVLKCTTPNRLINGFKFTIQ